MIFDKKMLVSFAYYYASLGNQTKYFYNYYLSNGENRIAFIIIIWCEGSGKFLIIT